MSDITYSILLVEDDQEIANLISIYLSENGFNVTVVHDGIDAEKALSENDFDILILDIMLPGKDGISICRDLGSSFTGKIVMFSAKNEEIDQIVGLEMGADEYLPKPVSLRLLLTKIKVLLRRDSRFKEDGEETEEDKILEFGDLTISMGNREVFMKHEAVKLTTAEYDLLLFLSQNAGRVLTRNEIYRAVRGIRYDGVDRSIDLRIARLRHKLGDTDKEPKLIKSIRGTGYLFLSKA